MGCKSQEMAPGVLVGMKRCKQSLEFSQRCISHLSTPFISELSFPRASITAFSRILISCLLLPSILVTSYLDIPRRVALAQEAERSTPHQSSLLCCVLTLLYRSNSSSRCPSPRIHWRTHPRSIQQFWCRCPIALGL